MDKKSIDEIGKAAGIIADAVLRICGGNKKAAVNLLKLTADLLENTDVIK